MAVTREGVPVRSWIFPGNTPDVTTVTADQGRSARHAAGPHLFVGDAGFYSEANLEELAKGAGKYILATPIRRIKEIKDAVLSHPGRYAEIAPNLRAKEVVIGDGESTAPLHSLPERGRGRTTEAASHGHPRFARSRTRRFEKGSSQGRLPAARLQALRPLSRPR